MRIKALVSKLRRNPAATENEIQLWTDFANVKLPEDYLEFLRCTNGAVGIVGKSSIVFLNVAELMREQEISRNFDRPSRYVIFANDGSNTNYAFDILSAPPFQIVRLDKIDFEMVRPFADDFAQFVEKLDC